MLTLNLTPIFTLRGIEKPFSFLVKNGFSRHAANLLINANTRTYRLDHVERLCELLVCEPNDLLLWTPDRDKKYPENLPLSKLIVKQEGNLKETLTHMPLSELKVLTDRIVNKRDDKE